MVPKTIRRLLFIFKADSGLWSAVVDSAKKLLTINGCALCSLTHGLAGERTDWKSCKDELGVPVDYVHRDEIPPEVRELVGDRLPCVVAEAGGEYRVLLSPEVLDRCRGNISDLKGKLFYYATVQQLSLPGARLGA